MAQKVIYQLIDDLDQNALGDDDGETVIFGLDGVEYEIDLSTAHAAQLREALAVYITAGRKRASGSPSSPSSAPARRSSPVKRDLESVRTWANENGFTVSTRGRIPAAVSEAYHAAHK